MTFDPHKLLGVLKSNSWDYLLSHLRRFQMVKVSFNGPYTSKDHDVKGPAIFVVSVGGTFSCNLSSELLYMVSCSV